MRLWFFALLLVNLAFFGWTQLVDKPAPAPLAPEKAAVPTLYLANEPGAKEARGPHCVSIGPFKEAQPQEMWRVALSTAGLLPRARQEGDPPSGWLDVDLPAGQAALDVTRLPGRLTLEGLTQGQCATVASDAAPAEPATAEPALAPGAAPADSPTDAAPAGKPLAG